MPQLYDDGLGTGRSAVDIWTMLPLAYNDAQSFSRPRNVTYVLQKGDKAWSYNDLVQDSYSPKWELDFLPINYRIQAGFISQSLGLTGLLYWSVDDWSANPWENPQGRSESLIIPEKVCWSIRVRARRPQRCGPVHAAQVPEGRGRGLRIRAATQECCGQAEFALA